MSLGGSNWGQGEGSGTGEGFEELVNGSPGRGTPARSVTTVFSSSCSVKSVTVCPSGVSWTTSTVRSGMPRGGCRAASGRGKWFGLDGVAENLVSCARLLVSSWRRLNICGFEILS